MTAAGPLDHTQPATIAQYVTWLNGYIEAGGSPTHFYDYPFATARFVVALTDVMVDSEAEYGAQSRSIIIPRGRKARRTRPSASFDGWGHTNLFHMDGYQHGGSPTAWVPVYSDPDFETVLTKEHRKQRADANAETAAFIRRAGHASHRQHAEGNDDACLAMLAGADFLPGTTLVLPSGTKLDADSAQAWTSVYKDDDQQADPRIKTWTGPFHITIPDPDLYIRATMPPPAQPDRPWQDREKPVPLCQPVGPCPHCGVTTAHLLTPYRDDRDLRTVLRECRQCGHAWQEKLDD